MKYMAGSHFSLMYSDVNENERLWVKVEQSLQTWSSAAYILTTQRKNLFIAETLEGLLPHCSGNLSVFLGVHVFLPFFLFFKKYLTDGSPSFYVWTQEGCARKIPVPSQSTRDQENPSPLPNCCKVIPYTSTHSLCISSQPAPPTSPCPPH